MDISGIWTIIIGLLGGGVGVLLLSRFFSHADGKRTDSASIFSKQVDDGDRMRSGMLDRIKSLEATVEKLMSHAIENERLKSRLDDLTAALATLRETSDRTIKKKDGNVED